MKVKTSNNIVEEEISFDRWLYLVCEHIANKSRKDITDVYSSIDLTNAKLSFIEGVEPSNYE